MPLPQIAEQAEELERQIRKRSKDLVPVPDRQVEDAEEEARANVQQSSANGLYQTGCACRIALCDSVLEGLEKSEAGIGKETLPLPEVTETGHQPG